MPTPAPQIVIEPEEEVRSPETASGSCKDFGSWARLCSKPKPPGWTIVSEHFDLIGDRVPSVLPVNADGHSLWRLRTGGFATPAEATAFCTRLQSERSRCWVVARS